ncbi:hypothetical protein ACWFR1_35505 [Streptomyces sp. NPDC055103]
MRLPVASGSDGTWVVNSPEPGMLGQGRTIARRAGPESRGWRLTLPAEFALTSQRPGAAHSALVDRYRVVLVGGRDGQRGPSAIAGIDPWDGRLAWRHALPPGSQVFLYERDAGTVLVAECRPGACRLTGRRTSTGQSVWTRTVPGVSRVLDACRADAFAPFDTPRRMGGNRCRPYLVGAGRIGVLDPEDGRPYWETELRPPDGVDRIVEVGGRIVMATAPARGSCRVTVLAGRATADNPEDRGWQRTFVWDQPQAPRDPRTGCRWDRTLPLTVGYRLALPEAEGALVVDPHDGPLDHSPRLAPGEYLVTGGGWEEIVRAPGRPDRHLSEAGRPVRPEGLSPAARAIPGRIWQDGRRLVLLDYEDRPLWEGESDCQAFLRSDKGGDLTYCDGTDLVTLRPVRKD